MFGSPKRQAISPSFHKPCHNVEGAGMPSTHASRINGIRREFSAMRSISFSLVWVSAIYSLWEFSAYSLRRRDVSVSQAELKSIVFVNMADLAFLEAKIVCGGAWGNDKMVWGFLGRWWEGAVAHYWCLAWGGR